jgi:hypothetical protein
MSVSTGTASAARAGVAPRAAIATRAAAGAAARRWRRERDGVSADIRIGSDGRLKKWGFDASCHERENAQTARAKHHQHLAHRNLFGNCFEKGIFNRKSRHGCNHPGNSQ